MRKFKYPIFCAKCFRLAESYGLQGFPGRDHNDHMVIIKRNGNAIGYVKICEDGFHLLSYRKEDQERVLTLTIQQAIWHIIHG